MEKKVVRSTIYNGASPPGLSLFRVSHTRLWWPLSLSPLVTNVAASRPSAEREDMHHFSIRWCQGSKSRSMVLTVLSDQAPARLGLHHLLAAAVWADPARRRSPSYIQTTPRYCVRPCSTARLPTSLHVENLACGSNIVLCPKGSSSSVLSILQSLPHTVLDKHNHVVIFP